MTDEPTIDARRRRTTPRWLAVAPSGGGAPVHRLSGGPGDLVGRVAALSAQAASLHHREVDDVLRAVVDLALITVRGAGAAGVLAVRGDGLVTAAVASDEVAARLDSAQVALGEGPGIDALHLLDPEAVATGSMPALAGSRSPVGEQWPRLAADVRRDRVGSVLSLPVPKSSAPPARSATAPPEYVLNLYGLDDQVMGCDDELLARALVGHASGAVRAARDAGRLDAALRSRDVIGQAKGILMQRHGLDADNAFTRLVAASQHANLKLREVALWLVEDTERRSG